MKKAIQTNQAPAPIGPYNQAILAGNSLYVSGQIALDPQSGSFLTTTIEAETDLVLRNLKAVVEAAGFTLEEVVKCSIFITDINEFSTINNVYSGYFNTDPAPARETVQVAALPKGARVEISCIAVK